MKIIDIIYNIYSSGDSNNFVILFPLVKHPHAPNDSSLHDGERVYINRRKDKNVKWVIIITECARNEPIVGRIVHSPEQHSIQLQQS